MICENPDRVTTGQKLEEIETEIAALELGEYLVKTADGRLAIRKMILDDIQRADAAGNAEEALKLKAVLHRFVDTHPENPKLLSGNA